MTEEEQKLEMQKLVNEIKELEVRLTDPKETICKHCLTISVCERYSKLKELQVFKTLVGMP